MRIVFCLLLLAPVSSIAAPVPFPKPTQKGAASPPAARRIDRLLNTNVNLNFENATLKQVVNDLRTIVGVKIVIDRAALQAAGISVDVPVSIKLDGTSLKTALTLIVRGVGLAFVVRDEILVVTTVENARGKLFSATYPVADLVQGMAGANGLIAMITRSVEPARWSDAGGIGTAEYAPRDKALVINQTADVHEQVKKLLASLRKARTAGGRQSK